MDESSGAHTGGRARAVSGAARPAPDVAFDECATCARATETGGQPSRRETSGGRRLSTTSPGRRTSGGSRLSTSSPGPSSLRTGRLGRPRPLEGGGGERDGPPPHGTLPRPSDVIPRRRRGMERGGGGGGVPRESPSGVRAGDGRIDSVQGRDPDMFLRAEQRSARTTSTGAEASPSRSFLEAGRIPSRLRNKHVEGGRPGHPRPSSRPRARVPRRERRLLRGSATASPSSP